MKNFKIIILIAISWTNQNYSTIVLATVFDVKWNDRFIVVRTHPTDIKESLKMFYTYKYRKGGLLDRDNNKGYFTQQEIDELNKVDSLAEKDVTEILKSNNLLNSKGQVTFYYLLDTKDQNQNPLLFLTESGLSIALKANLVGNLTNIKYFENLDKVRIDH